MRWQLDGVFYSDSYAQVGTVKHPSECLDLNASEPFLTLARASHQRKTVHSWACNSTACSPKAGSGGDQELTTSENWQVSEPLIWKIKLACAFSGIFSSDEIAVYF